MDSIEVVYRTELQVLDSKLVLVCPHCRQFLESGFYWCKIEIVQKNSEVGLGEFLLGRPEGGDATCNYCGKKSPCPVLFQTEDEAIEAVEEWLAEIGNQDDPRSRFISAEALLHIMEEQSV